MPDLSFLDKQIGVTAPTDTKPKVKQSGLGFLDNMIQPKTVQAESQPTQASAPIAQQTFEAPPAPVVTGEDGWKTAKSDPTFWDIVKNPGKALIDGAVESAKMLKEPLETTAKGINKNFILPVLTVIEDAGDAIGIKNDHKAKAELKYINKELEEYYKKNGYKKGDITPTDVQSFALETLMPALKTKTAVAALEAGLNTIRGVSERGETGTAKDLATDAGVGAIAGAVGKAVFDKAASIIKDKWGDGVLSVVQKFGERKGLTNEEISKMLDGVPKDKQALALANMLGEAAHGVMKQAVNSSDDAAFEMLKRVRARVHNLDAAADVENASKYMSVAKQNYGDMVEKLKDLDIGVNTGDAFKGIDLHKVEGWKASAVYQDLEKLKNRIDKDPIMSVPEVLAMKQRVNDMAETAVGGDRAILAKLNHSIDNLLENSDNLPGEVSSVIKAANTDYRKAAQNLDLADTVTKAKDEKGVINYDVLAKKLEEKGFDTKEAKATSELLDEYNKKFGNDYRVFNPAKGTNPDTGWLGFISAVLGYAKSHLYRIGEGGNNIAMQKLILKDLKDSKTPFTMANKIISNPNVSDDIRNNFIGMLKDIDKADLTSYDINALKGVTTDLSKTARQLDLKVRGAEVTINKKKANYDLLSAKVSQLEKTNSQNLANWQNKLQVAKKELSIAQGKYNELKTQFDDLGVAIENIEGFKAQPAATTRPAVTKLQGDN